MESNSGQTSSTSPNPSLIGQNKASIKWPNYKEADICLNVFGSARGRTPQRLKKAQTRTSRLAAGGGYQKEQHRKPKKS